VDSRFQLIFSDNRKLFQPGTDLLVISRITAVDLQSGIRFGQIKFLNLYDKTIKGLHISIRCYSENNEPLEGIDPYEYKNISVPSSAVFGTNNTIVFPAQETVFYSVQIQKIIFSDGTEQINEKQADLFVIPDPIDISSDTECQEGIKDYCTNHNISSDRMKYKVQRADVIWQCACGGINPSRTNTCMYCGAHLGDLLFLSNPEYGKQIKNKKKKQIPHKLIKQNETSYDGIIEKIKEEQLRENDRRKMRITEIEKLSRNNSRKLGVVIGIFIICIVFLIWLFFL